MAAGAEPRGERARARFSMCSRRLPARGGISRLVMPKLAPRRSLPPSLEAVVGWRPSIGSVSWSDVIREARGAERVVHEHEEPARESRTTAVPRDLHPALKAALRQAGIAELYTHQDA